MSDIDLLNSACRCERCGEWWYQGTLHRCKPVNQLDEAIRDRDKRIAELEKDVDFWTGEAARIAEERNRAIDWLARVGIVVSFEVIPAESKGSNE